MKVLITGAGGQLGSALQAVLSDREVIALTRAELDVANFDEVRAAIAARRPQVVINCAAYTAVDLAESDEVEAFKLNAEGPRNLAEATAEQNIALVQVSTDYVFDGTGNRAYHEDDSTNPQSVYGRSKLAGEKAVASINPRHFIARTAWLYHHEPANAKNFPKTMLAQSHRESVKVVNDQHGSPTYAPHLAEAIVRLIETKAYGVYHLAGRGQTTWFDLTRRLYQLFGVQTAVEPCTTDEFPRPAKRPAYSVLTTNREPEILLPSWEVGLEQFAKAMQKTS
ncbi:MAG: dTDP-4-dehydrorhamnose reductase [Acidobacteria bacterium]|nr:dTDP-4-dehydrorhamnose reductase [Acidobacteriota bacterium]